MSMSTVKTKVNHELVKNFIKEHCGALDDSFEVDNNGELSQAFFFESDAGPKVLRVNTSKEGFLKDRFVAENFSTRGLPIPAIEEVGELSEGMFYAISQRALGKTLDKYNVDVVVSLMPKMAETLDAIHATTPMGKGYGLWDLTGNGKSISWLEALKEMQTSDDDYKLADVSFFEKDLYEKLFSEIANYYKYCPEERRLVHRDFGFSNVISDGINITGVIDWEPSLYGDPLFDVAWLDFWAYKNEGYAEFFKRHYEAQDQLPENYHERVACYKLIIGTKSLRFFAKSNQSGKYDFAKQAIANIKR